MPLLLVHKQPRPRGCHRQNEDNEKEVPFITGVSEGLTESDPGGPFDLSL